MNTSPQKELITKKELGQKLRVSQRKIEIMVCEGIIPQVSLGGRSVRYDLEDVMKVLKEQS
jgi:predicted DNA-binding transcriptional regulator AlpA